MPSGAPTTMRTLTKSEAKRRADRELALREMARRDYSAWCRYVYPGFQFPPHIRLLIEKLEAVERGEIKRLRISMPPRHGKSLTSSKIFAPWFIARNPSKMVLFSGYNSDFSEETGEFALSLMREYGSKVFGVTLSPTTQRKKLWKTSDGGGMAAVGIQGAMTGRGATLLIIDDPIKTGEESMSATFRQKIWDWYASVAYTRLSSDGRVVVIMTRWNEDDLVGRLSEREESGGDQWVSLDFPAIATEDDILGRRPGDALWPDVFSEDRVEMVKKNQGTYWFNAMYQQRPSPKDGALFKRSWFRFYDHPEAAQGGMRYITIDPALSQKTTADYTVMAAWSAHRNKLYLLDLVRGRFDAGEMIRVARDLTKKHNAGQVWFETNGYSAHIADIAKLDGGLPIREMRADRDKVTRAYGALPRFEAGQVMFPAKADFLGDLETELLAFPNGKHDDQVDAIVYGVLKAPWGLGQMPTFGPGDRRSNIMDRVSLRPRSGGGLTPGF